MSPNYLAVLELIKKGDWNAAHQIVQQRSDPFSYQIHAFLHRLEGDIDNARYWYSRGDKTAPNFNLDEEFERLYEAAKKNS